MSRWDDYLEVKDEATLYVEVHELWDRFYISRGPTFMRRFPESMIVQRISNALRVPPQRVEELLTA